MQNRLTNTLQHNIEGFTNRKPDAADKGHLVCRLGGMASNVSGERRICPRARRGGYIIPAIREQPRAMYTRKVITATTFLEQAVQACIACLPLLLKQRPTVEVADLELFNHLIIAARCAVVYAQASFTHDDDGHGDEAVDTVRM